MKSSSGPRKTANLSESIHQQLNMYALAAGAAGVSLLALAQPSEAKIVYRPILVHIPPNTSYKVYLATSTVVPLFTLANSRWIDSQSICTGVLAANRGAGTLAGQTYTSAEAVRPSPPDALYALSPGSRIGPKLQFKGRLMVLVGGGYYYYFGRWINVTKRYLGARFKLNGQFHYGWARLNVKVVKETCTIHATLTGFAYETIPGKAIKAGQTKEAADDFSNEGIVPSASLTSPIPDTPQPASLGMLAFGAQGVPLWRRKEPTIQGD